MELTDDDHCFACGKRNKFGLRLNIEGDRSRVKINFTPKKIHQGYKGVLHGGIMSTLLDEAIAWVALKNDLRVLTCELNIRLKKLAKIGEPIFVEAKLDDVKRRVVVASAVAKDEEGAILAKAKGKLLKI